MEELVWELLQAKLMFCSWGKPLWSKCCLIVACALLAKAPRQVQCCSMTLYHIKDGRAMHRQLLGNTCSTTLLQGTAPACGPSQYNSIAMKGFHWGETPQPRLMTSLWLWIKMASVVLPSQCLLHCIDWDSACVLEVQSHSTGRKGYRNHPCAQPETNHKPGPCGHLLCYCWKWPLLETYKNKSIGG